MVIYGEILFLENAVSGAIILTLTGKLCGYQLRKLSLIVGTAMCGAYAFVLLIPMHWLAALASKLFFSAAVVMVTFCVPTIRSLIKTTGAFYIISFLMGGVTIAMMYLLKIPGMTANGSFVLKGTTFILLAAGIAATYIIGSWLAGLLREKTHKEAVIKEVMIHIGVHSWAAKALIDTGNSLKEPLTGYPVAVVSRQLGAKIKEDLEDEVSTRSCLIPYKSVGNKGLLYGVRTDLIVVEGKDAGNMILAISEGDFSPWKGIEKYDILLHQQLIEGEVNNDQEYSRKAKSVGADERMDKEILQPQQR